MKAPIKESLVKALTDGTYKQGFGALRLLNRNVDTGEDEVLHCCLGVLTDLYIEAGGEDVRWNPDDETSAGDSTAEVLCVDGEICGQSGTGSMQWHTDHWVSNNDEDLPFPVVAWAGLPTEWEKKPQAEGDLTVSYKNPCSPEVHGVQLMSLNDDLKKPFPEIARLIESDETL